jgi:beta-RFAP synthase
LAGRVLAFARAHAETLPAGTAVPLAFRISQAAPEHQGLGTGTQLGLAVASAVATAAGQTGAAVADLARCAGRGQRSGLGIHGFARGGLLVDGGKAAIEGVAPLVARLDFPEDWPLVIVLPPGTGLHGRTECQAFEQLARTSAGLEATDPLCRLVLLGLLPAAAERDWRAFGEALFDFNVRVGEIFAPIQGGVYAHPAVAAVVAWVRGQGVAGVGQSSWGPAVYAVAADADAAADLTARLRRRFAWDAEAVFITKARNRGATSEVRHGPVPSEADDRRNDELRDRTP